MLVWACAWVGEFVRSSRGVVVGLVTLFMSWEVCVRSTIAWLSVGTFCCNNVRKGGPLSSGAARLVVSLIGVGTGEGGRFGAFGLYFPLRLVNSSLLSSADL